MENRPTIGVLALQGAFDLHCRALDRLDAGHRLVKTTVDLAVVDALIIPGGESTTMRWLLDAEGMAESLACFVNARPVMGTCAGMVLLAKHVADDPVGHGFGIIDIDVRRNAYGRQVHSHCRDGQIDLGDGRRSFEMVFIRAPRIERAGENVRVPGSRNGEATMVAERNVLAMTFHPELSGSDDIHRFFIKRFVDQSLNAAVKAAVGNTGTGKPGLD